MPYETTIQEDHNMTLNVRELLALEFLRDWKTYAAAELDSKILVCHPTPMSAG